MKPYGTQTYTVTAALLYANGPVHIGHLAGAYLPADIYARYLRMRGHEVAFICGSDEGGVAILLQARQQQVSAQALIDEFHQRNKRAFAAMGISFDIFDRTSHKLHHESASAFFLHLHTHQKLTIQESEQFYDTQENVFLADRYLEGQCPHCDFKEAYGDQCEACGSALSPDELIAPHSKLSGATPIRKKTKHWYFPLQQYEAWLKEWILTKRKTWKTNVYGQCIAWLKTGLQARAITRDLNWGIPVPLPEAKGKVLYVWFEAPIGYISATQAWAKKEGKDWQPFWQDEKTQLVHFIGKDNIVFHCLIFPAMLKAHGNYIAPTHVVANEFMNLEGKKISTSRKHAVWLEDYLKKYPDKQDVLRYVLCVNAPETKDSNFRWEDYKSRNDKELVAVLGNFVNRVNALIAMYFGGCVPNPDTLLQIDKDLIKKIKEIPCKIGNALESFRFKQGLEDMMSLARIGNKYLGDTVPWKIAKTDIKRAGTILYVAVQIVGHVALYGAPFLPCTATKLMKMVGMSFQKWDDVYIFEKIPPGQVLQKIGLLFEKIGEKPPVKN